MIPRQRYLEALETALSRNPVVALIGPRQCGKTTLARQFLDGERKTHYFDLEDPAVAQAFEDPMTTLGPLQV